MSLSSQNKAEHAVAVPTGSPTGLSAVSRLTRGVVHAGEGEFVGEQGSNRRAWNRPRNVFDERKALKMHAN
jgi:hypothetical protein